jgi:hypothetical protein
MSTYLVVFLRKKTHQISFIPVRSIPLPLRQLTSCHSNIHGHANNFREWPVKGNTPTQTHQSTNYSNATRFMLQANRAFCNNRHFATLTYTLNLY